MNSSDLGEAIRFDAAARAHEKPLADLQEWAAREQAYTLSLGKGINGVLDRLITLAEIVESQGARIKALEARLDAEDTCRDDERLDRLASAARRDAFKGD